MPSAPLLPKPDDAAVPADATSKFDMASDNFTQALITELEGRRKQLSTTEANILNYFWNSKHQRLRRRIPFKVLVFLECDDLHSSLSDLEAMLHENRAYKIKHVVSALRDKGYVEEKDVEGEKVVELSKDGAVYLTQKHPPVLVYWKILLELTPAWASLLAGFVGFVASLFGIIQFVSWLLHGAP